MDKSSTRTSSEGKAPATYKLSGLSIAAIILGIVVMIGGIACMFMPEETYLSLAWLLGVCMVADGIASIVTWMRLRKIGFTNKWALVQALISIVLGVAILASSAMQVAIDLLIAYLVAAWLIVGGAMRMLYAWRMREIHKTLGTQYTGKRWWMPFILGALLAAFGIASLFNPAMLMTSIGLIIGLSIIVAGASIISLAF